MLFCGNCTGRVEIEKVDEPEGFYGSLTCPYCGCYGELYSNETAAGVPQ